jgi:phosphoglycolate phosphatase-like HAD superfamily hydrolase
MLTIVWDVDDVLNDLMRSWFEGEWLPAHPECRLRYADITQNPPHRVLGISEPEYLASLDAFRLSDRARLMQPNRDVVAWLQRSGDRFRHLALTARPLHTVPPLAEWVFYHYGAYVRTFGVVPVRQEAHIPRYDQSKVEFLQWLSKADVLVDDNQENVRAASSIGVAGVLYPQPWNRSESTVAGTLSLLSAIGRAD